MWCKKRRRKGGENKVTEDGTKQVRRDSVAGETTETSNSIPAMATTEEQGERTLKPVETSAFLRRQSIETVEMETENSTYAAREGQSFYDRDQPHCSYADEHPKAAYSQDSYYQRDYQQDYGESSRLSGYKSSLEDYPPSYSRDNIDNGGGHRSYSQSSVHYEQLSPPVDETRNSYPEQYKRYSYSDGRRDKEFNESSSRYRDDSSSYLYRERYSDSFSQKREVFDYSNSQYDHYPVAAENRVTSPQRGVDSYQRW